MEGLDSFFRVRRTKIRDAGSSTYGRRSFRANTNCAKRPDDRPIETADSNILKINKDIDIICIYTGCLILNAMAEYLLKNIF